MGSDNCFVGENIAFGYLNAWEAMYYRDDENGWYGWMYTYLAGGKHKENILNPNFTRIGIAYDMSTQCWVQDFYG